MEEVESLTINKEFAERYFKKKQAEELSRLRDKYGDVAVRQLDGDSSSSSSEEEDEEAEALTPQVERDFLRTLSLIKSKDPRIYDKDVNFFSKKDIGGPSGEKRREKPMYLKDYERKRLLERGSLAEVSDSEEEEEGERCGGEEGELLEGSSKLPTYAEEQDRLKESFKGAVVKLEGEEDGGDGGEVLTLRKKTKQEESQEDDDYNAWLAGKEGSKLTEREKQEMDSLKNFWNDPSLEDGEAFLRDYILNKGYMDKDVVRVPTYDEVVGSEDDGQLDDSEDEEALEKQEEFERKFNFRFEEPGGNLIESYPRTIAGSVRRPDDKRKQQRKERLERKEQEKETKREELKRLKNLKKKEIMEKLTKLATITGNPVESLGLSLDDIEEDFDPKEYDAKMMSLFGEEYYEAGQEDNEKPVFPDMEEDDELVDWDPWQPAATTAAMFDEGDRDEPHCDDPDFNMDADYHPGDVDNECAESAKLKRKRKRKSKFAAVVQKPKPTFEPTKKSFEEYLQEYYQLDSLVTGERFKYRKVVPNNFGLTTDEILQCRDKELNRWVSLSKSVQHRTEEEERRDKKKYRKRARDWKRKRQLLTSLYGETEEDQAATTSTTQEQRISKANTISADRETCESTDRSIKTDAVVSEFTVEDGLSVNVRESKKTRPTGEGDKGLTKMAESDSLSEETEEMVGSSRASKQRDKNKKVVSIGERVGERKARKKALRERETGPHKHLKSSRKKHQILLKKKLRKTVSKARLKSYGLSV